MFFSKKTVVFLLLFLSRMTFCKQMSQHEHLKEKQVEKNEKTVFEKTEVLS